MRAVLVMGVLLSVVVAGILALTFFLASIGAGSEATDEVRREPLSVVTAEGELVRLQVEIADTAEERAAGLSGREEVPDGTGMLFIFSEPGRGFWMEDTSVPLSVAFLAECGEIVEILQLEPFSREVRNTDEAYSFGLETPRGWFKDNGIEVGDLVSIPRDYRPDGC